jgi:methylglyoxal synthase
MTAASRARFASTPSAALNAEHSHVKVFQVGMILVDHRLTATGTMLWTTVIARWLGIPLPTLVSQPMHGKREITQ